MSYDTRDRRDYRDTSARESRDGRDRYDRYDRNERYARHDKYGRGVSDQRYDRDDRYGRYDDYDRHERRDRPNRYDRHDQYDQRPRYETSDKYDTHNRSRERDYGRPRIQHPREDDYVDDYANAPRHRSDDYNRDRLSSREAYREDYRDRYTESARETARYRSDESGRYYKSTNKYDRSPRKSGRRDYEQRDNRRSTGGYGRYTNHALVPSFDDDDVDMMELVLEGPYMFGYARLRDQKWDVPDDPPTDTDEAAKDVVLDPAPREVGAITQPIAGESGHVGASDTQSRDYQDNRDASAQKRKYDEGAAAGRDELGHRYPSEIPQAEYVEEPAWKRVRRAPDYGDLPEHMCTSRTSPRADGCGGGDATLQYEEMGSSRGDAYVHS